MKYSFFKTAFASLLLLLMLFTPKTWAQEAQKQVPAIIINGHFFKQGLPIQEIFSIQKGMQHLSDGEKHSALRVLVSTDFVIPEAWKKYEIARENVVNADKFEAAAHLFDEMEAATHSGDKQQKVPEIGQKLPGTFMLHDIDGGTWTQDSLRGHVTVVNVWYSGCGPCRKEMPELSTWKERFPQVRFLSADFETPEKIRQITEKQGFNWTHLARDNYFTKWVGSEGYPLTLILSADGTLQYMVHGTNETIRKALILQLEKLVLEK